MLTHIDKNNNPTMVDVSNKNVTTRIATAIAKVKLPKVILEHITDGEIILKKGPVLQTAIIAGTQAAKNTAQLIPFCHNILIESCKFDIHFNKLNEVEILCTTKATQKTGVEMEALTGASIAALTIYDMCKALSHEIAIMQVELVSKSGGKTDYVSKARH